MVLEFVGAAPGAMVILSFVIIFEGDGAEQ